MSGSRFDEKNFYGIGFNDPYDRFSDQIQKNHHESFEQRKKADEMVFFREKQRKNRFLGNAISGIKLRIVKNVPKPKLYKNRFNSLIFGVAVAGVIAAGTCAIAAGTGAFNNDSSFIEVPPGKVYNDPIGYEVFGNMVEFNNYCRDNGIFSAELFTDCAGKVFVASSTLNNTSDFVSDSGNFIETSKGEIYNGEHVKFDNEVSLRQYCKDNGINISQVRGFSSSDGSVYVSSASISLDNTIDSGYSK